MIYKLTQIHYQMQAEIYPDVSGLVETGRHNSIMNCRVNSYIIAKNYFWIICGLFVGINVQ